MARIAYFDCFSGVAGDMILGALVDAGLPLPDLREGLRALRLEGYDLKARKTTKGTLAGTKVDVVIEVEKAPFRDPGELISLIRKSELGDRVKEGAERVVQRIRSAEAAVHGVPEEEVHFHEIGLMDTAVDVVGAVVGLDLLGVEKLLSSPIAVGRGLLECSHGRLPVPPPASVEILKGIPTIQIDVEGEIATPTGCAILAVLSEGFGNRPAMNYDRVGYGAGDRDLPGRPNLVRVFLGETPSVTPGDRVVVLETNLDDLSPQILGPLYAKLLSAGAMDVWTTPCTMKKGRPGLVVSALCPPEALPSVEKLLFSETTTLGVRRWEADRSLLPRRVDRVETRWGSVRVKVASLPGGGVKWAPEFEDCIALAEAKGVAVREVIEEASAKARERFGDQGPRGGRLGT